MIPTSRPVPSILDTPVRIDSTTRTASEEIDTSLKQISDSSGVSITRAGMVDNLLDQTMVTMNHDRPMPARSLIEEALNAAKFQKVWLVGYEPSVDKFYLSTESTVKLVPSRGSQALEELVPQTTQPFAAH